MNLKYVAVVSQVTFVYVGKEGIHQYMQYEVFMAVYMGRIANQRKYQNGCHLKTAS